MKAKCPVCKSECDVKETKVQATRYESTKVIGQQAYCKKCDVYFKVEPYENTSNSNRWNRKIEAW